jgi:ABC-type bacteriocin/lantibiotic exporter with double-glycine peptidase domain
LQRRTATSVVVSFLAVAFAASWIVADQNKSKSLKSTADNSAEVTYLGSAGVVLQDRSSNCGVAALMMVLEHYGIKASQRNMELKAGLKFGGASLFALKEMAQAAGISAEGWMLSPEDLRRVQLPAILFVENHHFVVVDSIDGKDILFVRDPAVGRLKIPRRRAIDIWKGETLVITRASR